MFRSRFRLSLGLAVAAAAAAFMSAAQSATGCIAAVASACIRRGADLFDWLLMKVVTPLALSEPSKAPRMVGIVQHRAYQLRQVKREKPVVSSDWRMCPST